MNSNLTDVLFEELLKHPEDLDMFLAMYHGFPALYENMCVEFFHKCLVPKLDRAICQYNAEHSHALALTAFDSNKPREILQACGGLGIVSKDSWPEKLAVFLESSARGCRNFYAGVTMDWSKGDLGSMAGPFEQGFRNYFNSVSSSKQGMKYIYCDYPSRDWNSRDTFQKLVKDVLARRKGKDASLSMVENVPAPEKDEDESMAGCYVEMLMNMVKITDKVVKETGKKADRGTV